MFPGPWGFPFHMGGSQGEGRRRRRRSSDSSRSRDRRRARGRSRRSRSPARSERSQPQTAPLPPPPNVISLPQPQAGYVWQQVPAVPQMMTAAPAPRWRDQVDRPTQNPRLSSPDVGEFQQPRLLKSGQRQQVAQAEKHPRDQLLISCTPAILRETMTSFLLGCSASAP